MKQICRVCFHHCALEEGQTGLCGARRCVDGTVQGISYGQLTAIALVSKAAITFFFIFSLLFIKYLLE